MGHFFILYKYIFEEIPEKEGWENNFNFQCFQLIECYNNNFKGGYK